MDRAEYKSWAADFNKRFPETGAYINGLPQETRDLWFEELFSHHLLNDAKQMNHEFVRTGEAFNRFERDKLFSKFLRSLSERAYAREQRESGGNQSHKGSESLVRSDPVMGRALRAVEARQDKYREDNGAESTPDHLRKQWVDEEFQAAEDACRNRRQGRVEATDSWGDI